MTELLQQIAGGLATGCGYAGLALALAVIYEGTGLLNFAQGALATVAAFGTWSLVAAGWSVWLAMPVMVAASALLGALIERTLIRPVQGASTLVVVSVTAALLLGLTGLVAIVWDTDTHTLASPFGSGTVALGSVTLTAQQLGSAATALVVMGLIGLFFRYTDLGLRMRAVAQNPDSAVLLGIRPGRMRAIAWAIAAAIGAVAGVMAAPTVGVSAGMMFSPLLLAFAAAALGGFGSRVGAVVGGLIIGVAAALAGRYIPGLGGDLSLAVPFAVIFAVLVIRPAGLFGRATAVRA
ncbi:MAG TPA: branched-chain amino acid ABC transporter permease [Micromonosporaceae bacterium]|nr:branched-chain amino acid ABC transporter permease [Micromonosporaceae bacterium]